MFLSCKHYIFNNTHTSFSYIIYILYDLYYTRLTYISCDFICYCCDMLQTSQIMYVVGYLNLQKNNKTCI